MSAEKSVFEIREKLDGAPHSKQSLRLWLRLLSCSTVVEKRIRNKLAREFDTTLPRFDVLAALERKREGMTMGEMSETLMVSNGNVTGVVNRLLKDSLIVKEIEPQDRRTTRIRLSNKGEEDFTKMASAHEGWVDQMFNALDNDEIEQLMGLLAKLRTSIESNERPQG